MLRFDPYLIRRSIRLAVQRFRRGWDDSETWSLDYTTACFMLPRLRRFREIRKSYPNGLTSEEWDAILDEMIFAMNYIVRCENEWVSYDQDEAERVQKGLELFGEHFRNLWS